MADTHSSPSRPDREFFAHVEDIVRSLVVEDRAGLQTRSHRSGVKAWFGDEKAPRQHYEAQILRRSHVDDRAGIALEVGFHCEERDESTNEAVMEILGRCSSEWRDVLGDEAKIGPFFGAPRWRRLSDVWLEPDLTVEDAAFEVAARLGDYLNVLEPIRRAQQ